MGLTSSMVRGWEFRLQEKDFDKLISEDWRVERREELVKEHPEFKSESAKKLNARIDKIDKEEFRKFVEPPDGWNRPNPIATAHGGQRERKHFANAKNRKHRLAAVIEESPS